MKRFSQGATLMEVLVGATLLLLVLGLAFGYLLPATKASYRYHLKAQMQQSALVVFSKIQEASTRTSPGGLSWSTTDLQAVGFNPYDELQPANAILRWSGEYSIFWWDTENQSIKLMNWPHQTGTATPEEVSVARAKRLPPERLREVVTLSGTDLGRTLCQDVVDFQIESEGGEAALVQPLKLSIELEKEVSGIRLRITDRFALRVHNYQ